MTNKDSLAKNLKVLKNTNISVNYNKQYKKIFTQIEKKPFWELHKPLVLVPSLISLVLVISIALHTYNLNLMQQEVNDFLAESLKLY